MHVSIHTLLLIVNSKFGKYILKSHYVPKLKYLMKYKVQNIGGKLNFVMKNLLK